MPTLSRELRKNLEKVVIVARDVAEDAAEKALSALAVVEREPHRSMSEAQKALRKRLRAHARQLGDRRNIENGTQETHRLALECAYEQWHRMLFARFLAENGLLIEPTDEVASTLDEVKELARKRGKDWVALAGEFAVRMLPQVFRQDDPVLEVEFAPEDRKLLEELLASLPTEVFTANDSLGWTYQFWQTERKNEINESGDKIGADELPAVTQLFTEDYMVDFLLDNTLGAWHAGKILAANSKLKESAESEEELRKAVALPGCPWSYLRFIKGEDNTWSPAAGTFDGWSKTAEELKCLDPCMGSGHFIVAMFERLVALRMAEEVIDESTAVFAVIRQNLFGLEIDLRCTQIAAFNLALGAWKRIGYRALPTMNLACSGLAPNAKKEDWIKLAGKNERLQQGMARLHALFQDAPILGSLINPEGDDGDLLTSSFQDLEPLLQEVLKREVDGDSVYEITVTAHGLASAAQILADHFSLVATNVPYLGRGKQSDRLKQYCDEVYPKAKADLATCFVERCLDLCSAGGSTAIVSTQYWLFLSTYKKLREKLFQSTRWELVARLGSGAFETIGGEIVNVALIVQTKTRPDADASLTASDFSSSPSPSAKAVALLTSPLLRLSQRAQVSNPNSKLVLEDLSTAKALEEVAVISEGLHTGDYPRFGRKFWELKTVDDGWAFQQGGASAGQYCSGLEHVLYWEEGEGKLIEFVRERLGTETVTQWIKGEDVWGKAGVAVGMMGDMKPSLYQGALFTHGICAIVPKNPADLGAIRAFAETGALSAQVRKLDQKVCAALDSVAKVPFDLEHWKKVAAETYPHGLPKPFSTDPTQWLFNGSPKDSNDPLQVAVARLLGYEWPRQYGSSFPECPRIANDGLSSLADADGIVCISATKGEAPADVRLRDMLATAYGTAWDAALLDRLLGCAGYAGGTLVDWLRDTFFDQHCSLFHQRPFIWHIWDGERDGFHALVNYHRLAGLNGEGRKTLEKLAYSYLGDWIAQQRADQKLGKEGASGKLASAIFLQDELKKILDGEPPYDLFVRWKPLCEQAIGWQPDINDGVRVNIRPFMSAKTLKGRSIFRKAPKIKWNKDRGAEPARSKGDFPWFWSWNEEAHDFIGGRDFDGSRWNDLHYSSDVKKIARKRAEKKN